MHAWGDHSGCGSGEQPKVNGWKAVGDFTEVESTAFMIEEWGKGRRKGQVTSSSSWVDFPPNGCIPYPIDFEATGHSLSLTGLVGKDDPFSFRSNELVVP